MDFIKTRSCCPTQNGDEKNTKATWFIQWPTSGALNGHLTGGRQWCTWYQSCYDIYIYMYNVCTVYIYIYVYISCIYIYINIICIYLCIYLKWCMYVYLTFMFWDDALWLIFWEETYTVYRWLRQWWFTVQGLEKRSKHTWLILSEAQKTRPRQ